MIKVPNKKIIYDLCNNTRKDMKSFRVSIDNLSSFIDSVSVINNCIPTHDILPNDHPLITEYESKFVSYIDQLYKYLSRNIYNHNDIDDNYTVPDCNNGIIKVFDINNDSCRIDLPTNDYNLDDVQLVSILCTKYYRIHSLNKQEEIKDNISFKKEEVRDNYLSGVLEYKVSEFSRIAIKVEFIKVVDNRDSAYIKVNFTNVYHSGTISNFTFDRVLFRYTLRKNSNDNDDSKWLVVPGSHRLNFDNSFYIDSFRIVKLRVIYNNNEQKDYDLNDDVYDVKYTDKNHTIIINDTNALEKGAFIYCHIDYNYNNVNLSIHGISIQSHNSNIKSILVNVKYKIERKGDSYYENIQ